MTAAVALASPPALGLEPLAPDSPDLARVVAAALAVTTTFAGLKREALLTDKDNVGGRWALTVILTGAEKNEDPFLSVALASIL